MLELIKKPVLTMFEYRSLAIVFRNRCACKLCAPMGIDKDGYPILRSVAERQRNGGTLQSKVFCTYCRCWHYHGFGDGYRCAHCWLSSSPYKEGDYVLQTVESLPEQPHKQWSYQQTQAINKLPPETVGKLLDPSGPPLNTVLEDCLIWKDYEHVPVQPGWPVAPKGEPTVNKNGFFAWLQAQVKRDDPVGDIARDAVQDDHYPRHAVTLRSILHYLEPLGTATSYTAATEKAYREFVEYRSNMNANDTRLKSVDHRALERVHRKRCSRECCITRTDAQGRPELRCIVLRSPLRITYVAFCRYCRSFHFHDKFDEPGKARCLLKSSPYLASGYSLKEDPSWNLSGFSHKVWTLPQVEALEKLPANAVEALIDPSGPPLDKVLASLTI